MSGEFGQQSPEQEHIKTIIRERDEAWAHWVAVRESTENAVNKAKASGYRKGVEDAAKIANGFGPGFGLVVATRILALLDKPKLSEPPHNK